MTPTEVLKELAGLLRRINQSDPTRMDDILSDIVYNTMLRVREASKRGGLMKDPLNELRPDVRMGAAYDFGRMIIEREPGKVFYELAVRPETWMDSAVAIDALGRYDSETLGAEYLEAAHRVVRDWTLTDPDYHTELEQYLDPGEPEPCEEPFYLSQY